MAAPLHMDTQIGNKLAVIDLHKYRDHLCSPGVCRSELKLRLVGSAEITPYLFTVGLSRPILTCNQLHKSEDKVRPPVGAYITLW